MCGWNVCGWNSVFSMERMCYRLCITLPIQSRKHRSFSSGFPFSDWFVGIYIYASEPRGHTVTPFRERNTLIHRTLMDRERLFPLFFFIIFVLLLSLLPGICLLFSLGIWIANRKRTLCSKWCCCLKSTGRHHRCMCVCVCSSFTWIRVMFFWLFFFLSLKRICFSFYFDWTYFVWYLNRQINFNVVPTAAINPQVKPFTANKHRVGICLFLIVKERKRRRRRSWSKINNCGWKHTTWNGSFVTDVLFNWKRLPFRMWLEA